MFVMFVLGLLMARYRNGRTMYGLPGQESNAVFYTHLTLPTIHSVYNSGVAGLL